MWTNKDASGIDEMLHPEFVHEGITGEPIPGRDAFRDLHRRLCATFSEIRFEIRNVVAEGDSVAYQHVAQLTHAATGNTVHWGGVAITEVRDGMFVRGAESVEWLSLLQQLGHVAEDVLDQVLER